MPRRFQFSLKTLPYKGGTVKFTLGQRVRIAVGQFEDYEGLVIAQQPESGEVKIQIDVFGRPVPVIVPEDLLEVVE